MTTKKKFIWGISFFVLSLFSFYTLSGAFGLGTNAAYAQTLSKENFHKRGDNFMVVDRDAKLSADIQGQQEICSLTTEQVAELDAFFRVRTFELEVKGEAVTIAAVHGKRLNKKQLMDYLRASDADLECKIVKVQRIFFFPVLPQIS